MKYNISWYQFEFRKGKERMRSNVATVVTILLPFNYIKKATQKTKEVAVYEWLHTFTETTTRTVLTYTIVKSYSLVMGEGGG